MSDFEERVKILEQRVEALEAVWLRPPRPKKKRTATKKANISHRDFVRCITTEKISSKTEVPWGILAGKLKSTGITEADAKLINRYLDCQDWIKRPITWGDFVMKLTSWFDRAKAWQSMQAEENIDWKDARK